MADHGQKRPFYFCLTTNETMNNLTENIQKLHVPSDSMLKRSRWYGPNLFTFIATAEETGGAFAVLRCKLRRGFEPPKHVHTKEEESYVILDGEIIYEVGDQSIHAKAGDYVHLPRHITHKFRLVSETVTFILIITPGGFEQLFWEFSRPAEAMELPPIPVAKPPKEFFDAMTRLNEKLGVTMFPEL